MSGIIRTERSLCMWGPEPSFGSMVTPTYRFGIHDTVVAPDPEYRWTPFFGVGSVNRNRDTILRGPQDLRGSIPDLRLQDTSQFQILMGVLFGRASLGTIFEGQSSTDGRIPSLTMQIAYQDTNGAYGLVRNFVGGKMNRFSFSAAEGEELRLNLEEMLFLQEIHNQVGVFGYSGAVGLASDPGISDSGRFIFSGASIAAFGQVLARVRRFSLSVDNQIEQRYYIASVQTDGVIPDQTSQRLQTPNDLVEGKRVYRLEIELDLGDPATDYKFIQYLLNEGSGGIGNKTVGTLITGLFQQQPSEGGGSFTMNIGSVGGSQPYTPTTVHPGGVIMSAKHNIPAPPAGLVPVTLTMDVNNISFSIT